MRPMIDYQPFWLVYYIKRIHNTLNSYDSGIFSKFNAQ
jgi:hypothetical protein